MKPAFRCHASEYSQEGKVGRLNSQVWTTEEY